MELRKFGLALLAAAFMVTGCGDDGVSSDVGTLSVRLTDAPGDFTAVNITFSEIAAHIDGEWVTVESDPQTINLLEWNNGASVEIGRATLSAGRYTQIRLIIDAAEVEVNGQTFAMTVPSGAQTGLKLGPAFDIEPNLTFELVVDFDANRSVVATGPPQSPNGYQLKPRVRAVPLATSGAISGTVTNPANAPLALAISGSDTVTSSVVDTSGAFTLPFLPAGTYVVSVTDTLNASANVPSVTVEIGSTRTVGDLTLQ